VPRSHRPPLRARRRAEARVGASAVIGLVGLTVATGACGSTARAAHRSPLRPPAAVGADHNASAPDGASSTSTSTGPGTAVGSQGATTGGAPGGGIAPGSYEDGAPGTPHYALDVGAGPGGEVTITISFVYQDGRTQPTMTLTGLASGGTATMSGAGTMVHATYGAGTIVLDGCTAFLADAHSSADCTFAPAG
jgi:hypothetical protein